ncbi:hypothetical protein HMPREF7215_1417 [Pyramidobacter piscolens W5455]|uniref:Uncharacterized protein n=1 Tax=Pyramidobacter piscolens W5455 TaxID=352165 RepID=A0ABM9ZY85_9BACT|nr:hypothetical protein HMPREF7215_1417 [Pyramidobacter piscolens W5455]
MTTHPSRIFYGVFFLLRFRHFVDLKCFLLDSFRASCSFVLDFDFLRCYSIV